MKTNPANPVSFDCPDPLKTQLDEIADREGRSRSAILRELVADRVESDRSQPDRVDLPEDPDLQNALTAILENSHPFGDQRRVDLQTAIDVLYSNRIPKDHVKHRLISPLKRDKWIQVKPGIHRVWIYPTEKALATLSPGC